MVSLRPQKESKELVLDDKNSNIVRNSSFARYWLKFHFLDKLMEASANSTNEFVFLAGGAGMTN